MSRGISPQSLELAPDWLVVAGSDLPRRLLGEVTALCTRAYGEDFAPIMAAYADPVHVIGLAAGRPVTHALWVERRLQPGSGALLSTAFVEAVATEPGLQGRGLGSAVMRRIAAEVEARGYQLAALSPFSIAWYSRLGWEAWRGALSIRTGEGLLATPDEEVMILRLPTTPPLDPDLPLSAEWREGELW